MKTGSDEIEGRGCAAPPCSPSEWTGGLTRLRSGWSEKITDLKKPGVASVGLEVWVWGEATQSQVAEMELIGGVCRFDGQKTWLQVGHCGYLGQGSILKANADGLAAPTDNEDGN